MKRKYQKKKDKIIISKKSNTRLDDFFKSSQNHLFNNSSVKLDTSPLKETTKKLYIIRNPSKGHLIEETQEELKKYHNLARKTILCDDSIIDNIFTKLNSSFEKIDRFIINNKKVEIKNMKINLNKKDLITKFILQLNYTDIIYLSPSLLSDNFNEGKISQNIRNFAGFNSLKGVTMNFSPNNKKECSIIWPKITDIISKYLNNFHDGKGLYIYVEHDYLSYLNKIKLLCNLYNYETCVIDETNQAKGIILDKLSEAMQTKRLPSISEQLGSQMLLLEEMVNSFSYKWKIFTKNDDNNTNNNENSYNSNNNNATNNILSSISYNNSLESKNDPIILSSREIDKVFDELDYKSCNNSIEMRNYNKSKNINIIKIDENEEDCSKNEQLSTNESLFTLFQRKGKNSIKTNDKNLEQSESSLFKKPPKKSRDKSRDKSKNNSHNKSSELKKRRNKKFEDDINNTNIKGYFNENTKEHKTFTQLQNNIFFYCTKAKTAIIIVDSFSEEEKDKKYFNNILLKISQTKCPIIILTNNLNNIYNNSQKKLKNLNINCILSPKNQKDMTLIYLYNFIIYINIKLCAFKFTKNITTYEKLSEWINNIDIELINYELCVANLRKIYILSEYLCYYGKFQMDIIDLRLTEIFVNVEKEIKNNKINPKDFGDILEYIYNNIFINKENSFNILDEEKDISEICEECEMRSFLDNADGTQGKLVSKEYEQKLILNDSYENYCISKESMVNIEGLLLRKYLNHKELFMVETNNNNSIISEAKKKFTFYDAINNEVFNKVKKEDQLIISYFQKLFIPISSLNNYINLIKRKIIIKKNHKNRITYYMKSNYDESDDYLDIHNLKKLFPKIEKNFFLNKSNINFATNYLLIKAIKEKKITVKFYEK